jgi:outer membrane receptor protein involved in Fe transport
LLDVPIPVTALKANDLVDKGQFRLQDYFVEVPGAVVQPNDRGDVRLMLRGINTGGGFTTPTVGVVIDDIPFGSSAGIANGGSIVDLDPSDLAQIEILRGPQGTLYGASSIGGLLKYDTLDPSTSGLFGHVQSGLQVVSGEDDLGYSLSGAVNVPVTNQLAVRASGFTRFSPGYVDNILTDQPDINKAHARGAHFAAIWKPLDNVSLKLGALFQHADQDGSSAYDPRLGGRRQEAARGTGVYARDTKAFSAIIKAGIGPVNVTSLTGYNISHLTDALDLSKIFLFFTLPYFGVDGTILRDDIKTKKFSQELRAAMPIGSKVEWQVGLFYTNERSSYISSFPVGDPVTGTEVGAIISSDDFPTTFIERAAYTDLTYHFDSKLSLQLGGRYSSNRQTYRETIEGIYGPVFLGMPSPVVQPLIVTKDHSFTYLVSPQYKFSPNVMLYGRLASGYRVGGPNATATIFNLPPAFKPDTTTNYELGFKGQFFGKTLTVDSSIFYTNWDNIQINLSTPQFAAYIGNAGKARTEGFELQTSWIPQRSLQFAGNIFVGKAEVVEGFPPNSSVRVAAGDPLPFSAPVTGSASVDKQFALGRGVTGSLGGSVNYVGKRYGGFRAGPNSRQIYPAYTSFDLRGSVNLKAVKLNAYVRNLTDKRGQLSGGLKIDEGDLGLLYIEPRTFGVSVTKDF